MKKVFVFLIACTLYSATLQSRNEISGMYFSKSGICLIMNKDSFKLIMPNPAQNGRFSEIMAEGIYKRIDKSFVEFNSFESPAICVTKSMQITQRAEQTSNDSIKIKFSIPYRKSKLKIIVFVDTNFKTFELNYSADNNTLNIPVNVKTFSFYIIPEDIMPHTTEGLSYGIVAFDSLIEYSINKNVNYIEIEIPVINDSFFEKYYVKGDYAKVTKNTITWKGEVYIKKK